MNTIELKNVSFSYRNNKVFNQLSLSLKEGCNTAIIGTTGVGKTTLKKILEDSVNFNGNYLINDVEIVDANKYIVDRLVNTVSCDTKYENKSVVDILFDVVSSYLEEDKIVDEVEKIKKYFNINNILTYKIDDLNDEHKYYLLIISKLLYKNTFLVIDDLLCYLKKDYVTRIYNYSKKNNVTIVNICSDLKYVLNSNYLICLYNKGIAMEGETISCLTEEKLLRRLGYNLPFIVDLSIQLNYYNVIDNIYVDRKEMVNKVWK